MKMENLERNPVTSSNINALAYQGERLFVTFHPGEVYCYDHGSAETYQELFGAASIGRTFNALVKSTTSDRASARDA